MYLESPENTRYAAENKGFGPTESPVSTTTSDDIRKMAAAKVADRRNAGEYAKFLNEPGVTIHHDGVLEIPIGS
jgi:hypothetical protein